MRSKAIALALAMMMTIALNGVAVAETPGMCEVTFTVLDMENQAVDGVYIDIDDGEPPHFTDADNTVTVSLEQGRHYEARVEGESPPEEGLTRFYTGDATTMQVTIYMLYDAHDEGDTTRVTFEVTEAIGFTLHAHQDQSSIRAGQTDFPAVQFDAKVHHGGHNEVYEGEVTAFTKPGDGDGDWAVVDAVDEAGQIAFQFSADGEESWTSFNPEGHELDDFQVDAWNQEFWLKGITSDETPANTMGNIYFRLELIP